jgi:hypothetical protein
MRLWWGRICRWSSSLTAMEGRHGPIAAWRGTWRCRDLWWRCRSIEGIAATTIVWWNVGESRKQAAASLINDRRGLCGFGDQGSSWSETRWGYRPLHRRLCRPGRGGGTTLGGREREPGRQAVSGASDTRSTRGFAGVADPGGLLVISESLREVRVRILMRTGERDEITPASQAEIVIHGVFDASLVEHKLIPGAGHFSVMSTFPPEMIHPDFPPSQDPKGFDREEIRSRRDSIAKRFDREEIRSRRDSIAKRFDREEIRSRRDSGIAAC